MADNDPDAEVGESLIGGNNSRRRSDVRAGIRVDTAQLAALKKHLTEARDLTKSWREEMEKLATAAGNVQGIMTGKSATGTPRPAGTDTSQPVNSSGGAGGGGDGAGGGAGSTSGGGQPGRIRNYFAAHGANATGGTASTAAGAAVVGKMLSEAIKPLVQGMDARIDRGISYATSADRLNLLTQQMTGQSQMQVMQNMRQPLTQYRLGAGGVNAMMQFQAQTGVQASSGLARSIEALRMSSGFGKSTQDILTEQQQLMNPEVANRMFFMAGTNAFNIGGGMKDPLQTRQELVQRLGLDNPAIARSAMLAGSVTRSRLADIGLGEEAQTSILQYAQQQIQFREKGGKGMYDPSDPRHRQMMGIEDNLATQQEETTRVQTQREEQFMVRQIDNMAALEKSNQALIKALGGLEDKLSGVLGLRTSTRPFFRAAGSLANPLMMGGAAMMMNPATMPFGIAAMGIGAVLNAAGDPPNPDAEGGGVAAQSQGSRSTASDDTITVPYGYNGNRISLRDLQRRSDFQRIHPRMRDSLLRMMRANPEVGIGQGYRSPQQQEAMFTDRYVESDTETDVKWKGKYWKRVKGAPAAPPGRSMHEIGLAVDMVGDISWMNANASKFGLKHFGGVNGEPWHVQPANLPNSRAKYEAQGAPWGTDGAFIDDGETVNLAAYMGDGGTSTTAATSDMYAIYASLGIAGGTISDKIEAQRAQALSRLQSSTTTATTYSSERSRPSHVRGSTRKVNVDRKLTGAEVAAYAYKAGFRGQDLVKIVAIAGRESSWRTGAYNPDRSTGDDSYGLTQINMLGQMGTNRLRSFGISKPEDLYDPEVNMRAARVLFQSNSVPFYHWGPYKGMDPLYNTDMGAATSAVQAAGYATTGDPTVDMAYSPSRRRSGGGQSTSSTTHITSSPTINVAPVINFNGAPGTPDLRNIAQTVSRMIKEEVDMIDLRTA